MSAADASWALFWFIVLVMFLLSVPNEDSTADRLRPQA